MRTVLVYITAVTIQVSVLVEETFLYAALKVSVVLEAVLLQRSEGV